MARKAKRLTVTDIFEPVEVELWKGAKFRLREATRSIEEKVQEKWDEWAEMDDDTPPEEALAQMGELLDIMLEPQPGENGKKTHAKTVVTQAYKDDEMGLGHVIELTRKMTEAATERPT